MPLFSKGEYILQAKKERYDEHIHPSIENGCYPIYVNSSCVEYLHTDDMSRLAHAPFHCILRRNRPL
jgi:hypothetical protein